MAPANMLLAVHCKKGDHLDLKDPMWTYISATYSDQQAQDAADDLATVQQLRNDVVGLTGSLSDLRDTLARCLSNPDRLHRKQWKLFGKSLI